MQPKIAVVTGANGGIGKQLVSKLQKEDMECVCIDVGETGPGYYFQCDFTNPKAVEALVSIISAKFPKVDYLFNVAGIGIYQPINELSIADWTNSVTINLTAPFILTKGLLPLLERSEGGSVINFGSGMGVIPTGGRIAYSSTKFGLRGLSLSLSKEFEGKKVKFILLTLGSIMTGFGTGGIAKRQELAKKGKKYLSVEVVVSQILEIIKSENPKSEYVIYPEGYPALQTYQ